MATYSLGGTIEKSSNNGNTGNWDIPDGVKRIRGVAIGSGASGYQDNDGDDKGGGGGGGGCGVGYKAVSNSNNVQWRAAKRSVRTGPTGGGSDSVTSGQPSYVYSDTGVFWASGSGGNSGTDNNGGGGGGTGEGNELNKGGYKGEDDDDGGRGGGAAECPGSSSPRGGGYGLTVTWDTTGNVSLGCTESGSKEGAAYGGGGAGSWENANPEQEFPSGHGGRGYAGWSYFYADPEITSLTPVNQYNESVTSSDSPSRQVTVQFKTKHTQKCEVKKSGTLYASSLSIPGGHVIEGTMPTWDIGVSSTAGSNSPREREFNFIAYGYGGQTVTEKFTVKIKDDDNPSGVGTSAWTKTFTGLDPSETFEGTLCNSIEGIDMPIFISCSDDTQIKFRSTSKPTWGGVKKILPGDKVEVKSTIFKYDVDITGRTTQETGNESVKTASISVGPHQSFTLTMKTGRPRIAGTTQDLDGLDLQYPYGTGSNPKIHLGPGNPTEYLNTNTVSVDDIDFTKSEIDDRLEPGEISTEIKTDNSNIQVKRNSNSWQNGGQI